MSGLPTPFVNLFGEPTISSFDLLKLELIPFCASLGIDETHTARIFAEQPELLDLHADTVLFYVPRLDRYYPHSSRYTWQGCVCVGKVSQIRHVLACVGVTV